MRPLLAAFIGLLLIAVAAVGAVTWFVFRVYVPEGKCAVLIRKSGDTLPVGELVATKPGQRGIQKEVLGPGRYFYNPITWDYELKDLTTIPAGNPTNWEWLHSLDERQKDERIGIGPIFAGRIGVGFQIGDSLPDRLVHASLEFIRRGLLLAGVLEGMNGVGSQDGQHERQGP